MATRYIFVAGGVMSGVGKGVSTASVGTILQSMGYEVSCVKIDPYINVDAGTMNPIEHGETFVTNDGTECDQDIGNYERFLNRDLAKVNYMTTGSVYLSVINRERNLEYKGKCVEVVPHIPLEVISRIKKAASADKADFLLIEIGGTVGEYQNMLFLEAVRMMKLSDPDKVMLILVSYLPVPHTIGEMKTKPTQSAVRTLNAAGLQPDLIVARSEVEVDAPRKQKISVFCNVIPEDVISAPDVKSIYDIPLNFEKEGLGARVLSHFKVKRKRPRDLRAWKRFVDKSHSAKGRVRIGIVGKYFETGGFALMDSYISVIEAVKHACWSQGQDPEIVWLSAEEYEKSPKKLSELKGLSGVIVPGGFGSRASEGKIAAIRFCRENKIPFLGLCFGMQLAVIEFARHVAGIKGATSSEFEKGAEHSVIDVMESQIEKLKVKNYGATMRLGAYPCKLRSGTIAHETYKKDAISERHRHRYEVNPKYVVKLTEAGLKFSGVSPDHTLMEIAELPKTKHPFFVGTQFHPELQSRPLTPHPLFCAFVKAGATRKPPRLRA